MRRIRDPRQTWLDPDSLTLDDFAHHELTGAFEACPAGPAARQVTRDESTQTTIVVMSAKQCASCPLRKFCPIHRQADGRYELKFTDQARRRAARRREQDTEVFRERDTIRSGIESTNSPLKKTSREGEAPAEPRETSDMPTKNGSAGASPSLFQRAANSGLKNRLGLGKLRVRGRESVLRQLLLKVTGWNLLRTADSEALRTKVREQLAKLMETGCSPLSGHVQATIPPLHKSLWRAPTTSNTFPTRLPLKNVTPQPTTSFAA